jgi:glutamate-1-semialdehyde aminotransferase
LDLEFTELGLDSLLLTKVVSDVKKAFGIELNFRQLVDELSTPRRLIARLGDEQPRKKRGDRADAKTSSPGTASDAAHGPFKRAVKSKRELTTEQSVFLAELSAEYNAKTGKSKEQAAAYRNSFCDPRGAGGFRAEWKEMVYPIVCARSRGALLWDVDNNEYIDITLGFGANYLGHSPKFVVNAVREQLKSGFEVGPQTPLAGVVADKLCRITGFDRATFCNTGSEAVIAAMRVARASTGRDKIAMFSGSYHGIFDSVLAYGNDARVGMAAPVAAGIPESAVADTVILPYVDDRALQFIRDNAHDLAGVIVEPVQARHMNRRPDTFLRDLRKTTTERDVPLIFDEIVTGFRCALGGAQEYFGVKADMATYGKIIGGGMPIGALAGKAHYMNHLDGGVWSYGDASGPTTPVTFFAGTFVRHPLAMAACNSVLDFLYSKGSALQKLVTERVEKFASRLRSFCESEGIPLVVNQFASLVNLHVPPGQEFFGLLYYLLRLRGIHAWEGRLIHFSIEHTDENMDVVFNHYAESLMILKKLGFLDEERGVGA